MLNYINPDAVKPKSIFMFAKEGCPFCPRAKEILKEKGLSYEEISLNKDFTTRGLRAATGATTVPQVFIDGKLIGDSEAVAAHFGVK